MTRAEITIIDYGMGNLLSVSNALRVLDISHIVTSDPADVARADGIILPGVGAFGCAMQTIRRLGLAGVLAERVRDDGVPLLGICLGMQILAKSSEEKGVHDGLGWIDGHVRSLRPEGEFRVPHVGWTTTSVDADNPLFYRLGASPTFYFDHSFHMECCPSVVSATFEHGGRFVASVRSGNVFGVQFHPEKSQKDGLRLLRNFANLVVAREGEVVHS